MMILVSSCSNLKSGSCFEQHGQERFAARFVASVHRHQHLLQHLSKRSMGSSPFGKHGLAKEVLQWMKNGHASKKGMKACLCFAQLAPPSRRNPQQMRFFGLWVPVRGVNLMRATGGASCRNAHSHQITKCFLQLSFSTSMASMKFPGLMSRWPQVKICLASLPACTNVHHC